MPNALHLDADQLNAFAEGVLPAHERASALVHLADCPHCRHILFLAQQAEPAFDAQFDTQLATQPAAQPGPRPRETSLAERDPDAPFWHRWFRPAPLLGAAALACALLVALTLRPHAPSPANTQTARDRAPQQLPTVAPESSPALATSPQRTTPPASVAALEARKAAPPPRLRIAPAEPAGQPAPPPLISNGLAGKSVGAASGAAMGRASGAGMAANTVVAPRADSGNALFPRIPPYIAAAPANGRSEITTQALHAVSPPPSPQPSAAPADAARSRVAAASVSAAPPASAPPVVETRRGLIVNNSPLPASVNETVNVGTADQTVAAGAASSDATLPSMVADSKAAVPSAAAPSKTTATTYASKRTVRRPEPQPLPSHLPAAATAATAARTLAVDSAGALFLSLDGGQHWALIPPAWTGKAVRLAVPPAPAPQPPSGNLADRASATPAPDTFQLTTDTGSIWLSPDGLRWHPAAVVQK